MLVKDLRNLAKAHRIRGYSKMKKAELEKHLAYEGAIKSNFKIILLNAVEEIVQTFDDYYKHQVIQEMIKLHSVHGNRYNIFKVTDSEDKLMYIRVNN